MKNLFKSTLFTLLVLGFCFHTSFQTFDFNNPSTVSESLPLAQYTIPNVEQCSPTDLVCLLSNEAANLISSDSYAASLPSEFEYRAPTYTNEFTQEDGISKLEKTALTVADILTIAARVIIALSGAIFGARKAVSKLN
jgi:hypothetical protein